MIMPGDIPEEEPFTDSNIRGAARILLTAHQLCELCPKEDRTFQMYDIAKLDAERLERIIERCGGEI